MIFYIREKVFSFGDSFTIRDVNGYDAYKVIGKVFSLGNKLRLCTMDDRELVYIEQKLFKFLPEYHIYMDNDIAAVIKRELSFFKPKLRIESRFGNFDVEGSILAYNFTVYRNEVAVADINKKAFAISDTYEADISDAESYPFILSLVIAIDQIFHDDKNN